jgi:hypothetical protein
MRQAIVNVYVTGYAISLIALVASLAILITFRYVKPPLSLSVSLSY